MPHVARTAPVPLADLAERQDRLEAEVATLRAELAALRASRGPRDGDDRAVVAALAAALDRAAEATDTAPASSFDARSVVDLARLDRGLRDALDNASIDSARALGRLFARCEGHAIGGLVLERCGRRDGSLLWRLVADGVSGVSPLGGLASAE